MADPQELEKKWEKALDGLGGLDPEAQKRVAESTSALSRAVSSDLVPQTLEIKDVLLAMLPPVPALIATARQTAWHAQGKEILLRTLVGLGYDTEDIRDLRALYDALPNAGIASAAVAVMMAMTLMGGHGLEIAQVVNEVAGQKVRQRAKPFLPNYGEVLSLLWRGGTYKYSGKPEETARDIVLDLAARHGFRPDVVDVVAEAQRPFPDVGTLTELVRRGFVGPEWAAAVMGQLGFKSEHATAMLDLAFQPADAGSVLELMRRGGLDAAGVSSWLRRLGYETNAQSVVTGAAWPLFPVAEAGELWRRGTVSNDQIRALLGMHGFRGEAIERLMTAMRPLDADQTLSENLRRGKLSESDFRQLVARRGFDTAQTSRILEATYNLLDPATVRELWRRRKSTDLETTDALKRLGLRQADADKMLGAFPELLPPDVIRLNLLRGKIKEDQASDMLRRLGYPDEALPLIRETFNLIPPIQDIISMAVHEVFPVDPRAPQSEASMRYGLRGEYPKVVADYAAMQGLSPDWSLRYWENHWQWPGFTMLREMLFRAPGFTQEDFVRIMRYNDYPPGLLKHILAISYEPLARVDIRRMHDLGILDDVDLAESYGNLGYSPRDSGRMAAFTVALNEEPRTMAARSQVVGAFKEHLIARDEAEALLRSLRFRERDIESFIAQAELERELEDEKSRVGAVKSRFVKWRITENEARRELAMLGYSTKRIDQLILTWLPDRIESEKLPTKTEATKWWKMALITDDELIDLLTRQGYSVKHAGLFLRELKGETPS